MQTSQEVIQKLQKLLRLAGSANRNEAELAMQRAQEIAVKYKIELASVSPSERPVEEYLREGIQRNRSFQQRYIDWLLPKHFSVKIIHAAGTAGSQAWFIGKSTDIAFAKWVHEFLQAEFPRLWQKYQRETRCGQGARTDYFYGLYVGLDAKLTEARQRAEKENIQAGSQLATSYQLAVVSDREALAKAVTGFFPRLQHSKASISGKFASAITAGRQDGRNINISRPLGGRSATAARLH